MGPDELGAESVDGVVNEMRAVFLSASIPEQPAELGPASALPYLIQTAVRELMIAIVNRRRLIWGGHPSITPMVAQICKDLGVRDRGAVTLFQSEYFQDQLPKEVSEFADVRMVSHVPDNKEGSIRRLREVMLSEEEITVAVFAGGMGGIEEEYATFHRLRPTGKRLLLGATGGATALLAKRARVGSGEVYQGVNFARLFNREFDGR